MLNLYLQLFLSVKRANVVTQAFVGCPSIRKPLGKLTLFFGKADNHHISTTYFCSKFSIFEFNDFLVIVRKLRGYSSQIQHPISDKFHDKYSGNFLNDAWQLENMNIGSCYWLSRIGNGHLLQLSMKFCSSRVFSKSGDQFDQESLWLKAREKLKSSQICMQMQIYCLLFVFFFFSGHRSVNTISQDRLFRRAFKLGSLVDLHEGSPPNIFGDDLYY